MNERAIELYKQAVAFAYNTAGADAGKGTVIESLTAGKFAELIVLECMEQVRGEYLPVLEDKEMMKDTHWDGYVQCGVDSYVAIREHFFGVEE
jgi:hypothetical protein